jgi:membrane protein implicated in regulation of membrane protease activity
MKIKNKNSISNFEYYNLNLNNHDIRIIIIIIIVLIIILTFKKFLIMIIEKLIVFTILFLLILIISKNFFITLILSIILFLLINLIMNYRNTIEKFEDLKKEVEKTDEFVIDKNMFNTKDIKNSSKEIKDLLNKLNGGVELKDDDLKETDILNINTSKYSDDNIPNPLRQAQKETYQLIDTVNTLKNTITTLAPVLSEGKKLIDIFQNLKI